MSSFFQKTFFTSLALVSSLILSLALTTTMPCQAQWNTDVDGLGGVAEEAGLPEGAEDQSVLVSILKFLLTLLMFLTVISFVVAGIIYVVGGGDPKKVELATNIIKYTIIGLVVALLGYVVIITIDQVLN